MKTDIFGIFDFSFDGRKQSLLISHALQNFSNKDDLNKKVSREFMNFMGLVPKMQPEHIVAVRWNAGYEFDCPMDYYGIGAISCNSIQPWKHHSVDHIIQDKNPFRKLPYKDVPFFSPSLLGKVSFDYNARERIGAKIFAGKDFSSNNNYNIPEEELFEFLKKENFNYQFYGF